MTTGPSRHDTSQTSREHINALRAAKAEQDRRRRWWIRIASIGATAAVIGLVVAMALSSRQESSATTRVAPDFTLTDTSGTTVSLAALRGKNVLLYFSEGAGCEACLVQMSQIEKDSGFATAGLTVLPIVMNSKDQITADMAANGVRTPFLLDDGTVSTAYGTIGKGMHADLPGHSFVLIDKAGNQRWYGEYPSMWLSTTDLLKEVHNHLTS
ncbi:MAG: redoxin domain-containing protein [Phycicoccus sp.]|nr:redoxin domain-containing protein [Phycicoccus sp.]NMM33042.1 redoxin domain-containing protein [Phycicoccus sp.]